MSILLWLILFNKGIYSFSENQSNVFHKEWVCIVNSVNDQSCSTYGISKSKELAYKAALNKCREHCNSDCELDYCEYYK